jgi:hypothetical protein
MASPIVGEPVPRIDTWSRYRAEHACYFCKPTHYPTMPAEHTLCARCGVLMWTGIGDQMNEQMVICSPCDMELFGGDRG